MNTFTASFSPTLAERRWATGVHLGALVLAFFTSWMAGLAGALGAGVVVLVRPADSAFVAEHAKEAFNFNFSMFLYAIIATVLAFVTLGLGLIIILPIALILGVVWVVCTILAAMKANDGLMYRYPLALRLWR